MITLANDTFGFFLLWTIIPIFIGIRSYVKRGNGVLAIAIAMFSFSICEIVGNTILPIPLYYAPDPSFTMKDGIIFLTFDQYLLLLLSKCMISFCLFLLLFFFLRAIFFTMKKFWKANLVMIAIFAFYIIYYLVRNAIYKDVVSFLNFYSLTMSIVGCFTGYFLSYLLEKINPNFYKRFSLLENPKKENPISYKVDLD